MIRSKKTITRHDVAHSAGVSHMTVSRVLNGDVHVKEETRRKVFQACQQLNYRKNLLASSLRSMRSHALAVVVPTFRHEFYSLLLSAIEEEAGKADYCLIASQLNSPDGDPELCSWDKLANLCARKVDGILIDADLSPCIEQRLFQEKIPVVCINRSSKANLFDYIGTDYRKDFQMLTESLLINGHRDVAFAGGISSRRESRECYEGYVDALQARGLNASPELYVDCGFSCQDGIQATRKLLASSRSFTAVVAINDYVAIGLISELSRQGYRVPGDFAVTGHAGETIAQYYVPSITTGVQPIQQLAAQAMQRLLYRIQHPDAKDILSLRLPGRLVIRESSGREL